MNPEGNDDRFPKLPDGSRDLVKDWSHTQTWKLMEKLPKSKARNIGVCNYSVPFLQELLKTATTTPAVNQIENHPLLPQQEIVDFCTEHKINITAYSPLGSTGSPLFKNDEVLEVAKAHDVTAGTVLLSYHVARGSSVLAKSVTESRIKENMKIIELSKTDMDKLDQIHKKNGVTRYVYPEFGVKVCLLLFSLHIAGWEWCANLVNSLVSLISREAGVPSPDRNRNRNLRIMIPCCSTSSLAESNNVISYLGPS